MLLICLIILNYTTQASKLQQSSSENKNDILTKDVDRINVNEDLVENQKNSILLRNSKYIH